MSEARERKDFGALLEHILDSIENGQVPYAARQLALLHPLLAQQVYARARMRDREGDMVILAQALAHEMKNNYAESEATQLLRNLYLSLADPIKLAIAVKAVEKHLIEVDCILADEDFHPIKEERGDA